MNSFSEIYLSSKYLFLSGAVPGTAWTTEDCPFSILIGRLQKGQTCTILARDGKT